MPYPLAPVTAGRAERVYALLCRFGVDALLDEALAPPPVPEGAPLGPDGRPLGTLEVPATPALRIDLGRLFREAAREGGLAELADIVLVCSPEAPAAEAPVAEVRAALLGALVSFGAATA